MRPVRSFPWFQLISEDGVPALLYDASRPSQLAPVVGQPQYTYPALTCFLGGARKDRALRQLFPDNPRRKVAGFNLQIDHRTQSSSRPILFAEGDPHATPQPLGSEPLGSAEHVPLSWGQSPDLHTLDLLLARFLLPFAHVTCVFADDVGGLKGVHTLLQSWSLVGRDATYPLLRPRIIVVVETDEPSTETLLEDPAITPALFLPSGGPELFASVHVLSVPRGHTLSDEARFRTLKEEVLKAVDWADRDRLETQTQFSSVHLPGLLHKAVTHMAQDPSRPFNLIAASRPDQRPGEWTSHIIHYLCQSKALMSAETQDLTIASSLLLEAFPPNTHAFHPHDIFRDRYRSPCLQALQRVFDPITAGARSCSIESSFVSSYTLAAGRNIPLHHVYAEHVAQFQSVFEALYSNHTCLGCLLSSPQHPLPCGHALCDACVRRYGRPKPRAESVYYFEACPLCQRAGLSSIAILPPTAAVRALTVDGGGVRIVVALQILLDLQDHLGPQCPLAALIDVAWGTSAGALVVLDVFVLRRSFRQCSDAVQQLLRRFFREQQSASLPVKWRRTLRCLTGRGLYDSRRLDALFRDHYGSSLRLWDPRATGTKLGITTTSSEKGPTILTNYKPVGQRPEDIGYYHLSGVVSDEEPLVWMCARASSAAPMFFRPIRLPSLGYCWDGGLMHNCPAALCVQELKYMWPWSPPLGVLLSVGTGEGSRDAGRSAQRHPPRLVPRHHFFWPLHDTLMTETDGALSWLRFASQGSRAYGDALCRLDIPLSGPAPPLDAAYQIDDLVQQARAQRPGETGRRSILRLLAQSLLFELASAPERDARSGSFHCVGAIRCRISGEVFVAAFRRVSQARNQYVLNGRYLGIDMDESSICRECGRHCLPINFKVQRLQEVVQLSVRLDNGDRYPVGGFPNPMLWFMERQGFSPTFGLAGNGIALRDECQTCERRIGTRRGLRVMKLRARQKVRTAYAVCAAEHSAQIENS